MAVAPAAMIGFPQAYLEGKEVKETSSLVTELCRHFYTQGWVSGTGGSITIKVHDASIPKPEQLIVMSPSGVQKERMQPEDMYILSANGSIISSPSPKPYPNKPPKCTDCAPLFMKKRRLSLGKSLRKLGYKVKLVQFEQYPTLDVLVGFFDPYNIQYMSVVAWIQSGVRTKHYGVRKRADT